MNGKEIQQTNRSRNKCGMTEFCHCEVPKARHHVSQYSCALSSHCEGATHIDMLTTLDIFSCHCEGAERPWQSQGCEAETCNRKTVAIAKSLDNNEITTSCATPRNDKYVSEAHSKELNVLKSYRLNDFKKKVAFTLAEVLITLGIIGIVAAMTIPTLISNYKSVQLQSQLKKTYSSLSQAVNMIYAESGLPVTPARYSQGLSFYKDLMKYMKVAEDCGKFGCISYEVEDGSAVSFVIEHYKTYDLSGNIESMYFDDGQFILQDGTLVMCENVTDNLYGLLITADINGTEKGPNAWGHDLFTFEVQDSRLVPSGAKGTHFDLELYPNYCSETSSSGKNGIACTEKALTDHDYFKNLPK